MTLTAVNRSADAITYAVERTGRLGLDGDGADVAAAEVSERRSQPGGSCQVSQSGSSPSASLGPQLPLG
jgi:hypothetical protein